MQRDKDQDSISSSDFSISASSLHSPSRYSSLWEGDFSIESVGVIENDTFIFRLDEQFFDSSDYDSSEA